MDAFVALDREVAVVRLAELLPETPKKPEWTSMNFAMCCLLVSCPAYPAGPCVADVDPGRDPSSVE